MIHFNQSAPPSIPSFFTSTNGKVLLTNISQATPSPPPGSSPKHALHHFPHDLQKSLICKVGCGIWGYDVDIMGSLDCTPWADQLKQTFIRSCSAWKTVWKQGVFNFHHPLVTTPNQITKGEGMQRTCGRIWQMKENIDKPLPCTCSRHFSSMHDSAHPFSNLHQQCITRALPLSEWISAVAT